MSDSEDPQEQLIEQHKSLFLKDYEEIKRYASIDSE